MTWSERVNSAWTTFKREALPLYGWTLIFVGVGVVGFIVFFASLAGVFYHLGMTNPQLFQGTFSSGMPIPGMPTPPSLFPFANQFKDPLNYTPALFSILKSLAGIFLLIVVVSYLIGSAFTAGLFNLTSKAYREKASFKDFRFTGLFRILGLQIFFFCLHLLLVLIGTIGVLALNHSPWAVVAFLIIYTLFIIGVEIYALPWLSTSYIYLLAHREKGFWQALKGSWAFFRRNVYALWGYIGTVFLVLLALLILSRISEGLAGLATLVVSPFIAVLAIVWVLSLEDVPSSLAQLQPELYPNNRSAYGQDLSSPVDLQHEVTVPDPEPEPASAPSPEPELAPEETPPILLEKEPSYPVSKDKPQYCPSCGKFNSGTSYCPQCGTKL